MNFLQTLRSPSRSPLSLLLVLVGIVGLGACGDRGPNPDDSAEAPPAEATSTTPGTAPPPVVTLPPSGEITTSAATPSSPATRQLSPEEQAQVLNLMMNRLADRQAKGLGNGFVHVNGAWHYDGYSILSPNPASEIPARMVAIDLTVQGHTAEFDPDDIEIVDGLTMVSYGSDPHLTFLRGPREPIEDPREFPVAPKPTRMLLIYAFPKGSQKFTLFYWGQKLLKEPMTFEPSGWGLPYPE